MVYDDEFYVTLPDDPYAAGKEIIQRFRVFNQSIKDEATNYHGYVEAFGVLRAFCQTFSMSLGDYELSGDKNRDINWIKSYFSRAETQLDMNMSQFVLEQTSKRFELRFGRAFKYTFSDGDLDRIQTLINELRERLSTANYISPDHKSRLLKRLEALQSELHKHIPSLDKFWGVVGDAGVVLGKFGSDAKPLFDRFKEIAQIVWRTQARAEELPSGTPLPLLNPPEESEESSE